MARVLLVEDDEIVANLVRFLLERQGHELHWAADGQRGKELITELSPELVLMDVLMPYIDGFTLLVWMREQAAFQKTPVLMLTGKVREDDISQALDSGANDYLSKPFQPKELLARVERLLR